ncbi:hypothetical protein D3C73_1011470 [compost metagenome]
MQRLDGDDRAGGANGVTQADAATVRVDLGRVQLQFARHGASLRGKGFVGFDDVQLVHRQAGALERGLRGGHRADAHDVGVHARMRVSHQARQRLDATLGGH